MATETILTNKKFPINKKNPFNLELEIAKAKSYEYRDIVEKYQCPGCISGRNIGCGRFYKFEIGIGCGAHTAGTQLGVNPSERIFLGLPKGFSRTGPFRELAIIIFKDIEQQQEQFVYDWLNIPVWKYKTIEKHILIRGISPRINVPFLHIILKGKIKGIDCCLVKDKNFEEMS